MTVTVIRKALPTDLEAIRATERAAGSVFRAIIGMDAVADDEPAAAEELMKFLDSGMAWVEVDPEDRAIAFLLLERLDDSAHIEQVTVHPEHSRRGIGAALIDEAARWATRQQLDGLTLTTFENVPWNAPYYARLGFVVLPEDEWTPELRAKVAAETEHGLDAWPRVVMKRGIMTEHDHA